MKKISLFFLVLSSIGSLCAMDELDDTLKQDPKIVGQAYRYALECIQKNQSSVEAFKNFKEKFGCIKDLGEEETDFHLTYQFIELMEIYKKKKFHPSLSG